jgi:preprotein translocase subunit SecG
MTLAVLGGLFLMALLILGVIKYLLVVLGVLFLVNLLVLGVLNRKQLGEFTQQAGEVSW